jgi:hypothetical protein
MDSLYAGMNIDCPFPVVPPAEWVTTSDPLKTLLVKRPETIRPLQDRPK